VPAFHVLCRLSHETVASVWVSGNRNLVLERQDRANPGKTKEHGRDQGAIAQPGQIIARNRFQKLLSVPRLQTGVFRND
jgi:hypothetical protein